MSDHIKKDSVLKCFEKCCNNKVRLFRDFRGNLSDFRCAEHLSHLTFSDSPKINDYTNCDYCNSQYKFLGDASMLCHVCFNEMELNKLNNISIFSLPIPKPFRPKPDNCEMCDINNDLVWTLHSYSAEVHNTIYYGWYCDDCLYQMFLES